jgi:hypothetical protein
MAAGSTYTPISTTTLGTATTTVSFSSIPSTYTDLILICNPTGIDTAFRIYNFNGDTGSNYSYTYLTGNGTSASSGRDTTAKIFIGYGGSTTTPMTCIVNFANYSNTTTYKTTLARGSSSTQWVSASVGLWRNTAAISSFTIISDSTNFSVGSTFTLYGIAAA